MDILRIAPAPGFSTAPTRKTGSRGIPLHLRRRGDADHRLMFEIEKK
jgi:hypothetical protein